MEAGSAAYAKHVRAKTYIELSLNLGKIPNATLSMSFGHGRASLPQHGDSRRGFHFDFQQ